MEADISTKSGQHIHYRDWQPVGDIKAVIMLVHGLAEHSGRYGEFADFFSARGFAVFAVDHLGHGASAGKRCHINSFDDFISPLEQLLNHIQHQYPGKPVFIVGHSMGGLIASSFLLTHQPQLAGCILSGAAFVPAQKINYLQKLVVALIAKLFPAFGAHQLESDNICRSPEVVQAYREDPLVHSGKVSAQLVYALITEAEKMLGQAATITVPILILHGAEDKLTTVGGSKKFFETVSSEQKKLIIYDDLYHEIFNEDVRPAIFQDILNWIDARLS